MTQILRIGTRSSPLALAQARLVADALAAHGVKTEFVPITTAGDAIQDRPLAEFGGKALWTKELDRALGERRTDLSVHSMKDVETLRPDHLTIVAMLARADTSERLIGAESLDALPRGARIGTSSPRRRAQLLARRPDLVTLPIRGNIGTRMAKVARGEFDATLLAAAGLDRLGITAGVKLDLMPAPAQGAIGIEILAERADLKALLGEIDHRETHDAVDDERAFLAALGGDCHSAVAAQAAGGLVRAELLSPNGDEIRAGEGAPEALAERLLGEASPALRALFRR